MVLASSYFGIAFPIGLLLLFFNDFLNLSHFLLPKLGSNGDMSGKLLLFVCRTTPVCLIGLNNPICIIGMLHIEFMYGYTTGDRAFTAKLLEPGVKWVGSLLQRFVNQFLIL